MDDPHESRNWAEDIDTTIKDAAGQADDSGVCVLCNSSRPVDKVG